MDPTKIDVPELIGAELPLLHEYYNEWPRALRHRFASDEDFLRYVIDGHRPLIERWGGWRRHVGPIEQEFITRETLWEVIRQVSDEHYETFSPYPYYRSLPRPADSWDLYRSKLFVPRGGEKECEIPYAAGHTCKIRTGQSVPKAVLRAVREHYPDNAAYLKAFERFFELLGQAWATSRYMALTLSCAPSSIIKFGHYGDGVDGGSCFRSGLQSERTKINTAMLPNSFSVLFYTGDAATQQPSPNDGSREKAGVVQCRVYGMMGETGALVTNIKGFTSQWSRILPALTDVLSEEMGLPLTVGRSSRYGTSFYIEYWELNDLIASDGNAHVFAREGEHGEVFTRLKNLALKFNPPEAIRTKRAA